MAPIIQAGASMKTSAGKTARCHRKVFLLNILLGIAVTAIALYMVITGEYSNLAERKDVEGTLNMVSLFGFIYATGAWYGYIFFTPDCEENT
jgi:hypothetical protein